jgi:hypothetical protein
MAAIPIQQPGLAYRLVEDSLLDEYVARDAPSLRQDIS